MNLAWDAQTASGRSREAKRSRNFSNSFIFNFLNMHLKQEILVYTKF